MNNYQEQIKFKNLKIETDFKDIFTAEIDFNLAEILVGNILLNALKYAPKESLVKVFFSKKEMVISNIAEQNSLDEEKLFKRFQRQNHQEKGTGLDLEIAKKIADSFHLNLSYQFKNKQHYFILQQN